MKNNMVICSDNDLENIRNSIEISESDLTQLITSVPKETTVWEYISHKCMSQRGNKTPRAIKKFVEAYQLVRDDLWPSKLESIEGFYDLPESLQQECLTVHKYHPKIWFDPTVLFDSWAPSQINGYSAEDLIRVYYILYKNRELITGKRVIDFPCHFGNLSFFLSNMKFDFLTLAEVRPETLALATEVMQLLEVPQTKWSATQADLHNFENTRIICQGNDTIICSGVLYHIHDHLDVLESMVKSGIKNIIIETEECLDIKDSPDPAIQWITEYTENWGDGWHDNKSQVFVGYPNTAWLDMAMNFLGCEKIKPTEFYPCWYHETEIVEFSDSPTKIRSVHVYANKNIP